MKKVSTADLKANLSKYLGMVKEGQTFYVTSHRRSVAQLTPCSGEAGLIIEQPTAPISRLQRIEGITLSENVDVLNELLLDRNRR